MQTAFQLSERLAANNCAQAAPRMIRSRYNDPYLRDGDVGYYLTAWPDGQSVEEADRGVLTRVVQALASWHREAKRARLTVSGDEAGLSDWFEAAAFALAEHSGTLDASKQVLADAGWLKADEQAAAAGWLCHGFLVPKHVRVGQSDCTILHYEHVFAGHPLFDFACFVATVLPRWSWDKELLQELALTYAEELPELEWSQSQLAALLHIPFATLERAVASQTGKSHDTAESVHLDSSEAQRLAIQSLIDSEAPIQHADMTERDQDLVIEPASAAPKREPIRIKRYRPKAGTEDRQEERPAKGTALVHGSRRIVNE